MLDKLSNNQIIRRAFIDLANAFRVVQVPTSDAPMPKASQAVITEVAINNASFEIAPANTDRKGMIIHNRSNKEVLIAYAATASESEFTVPLPSRATFIMPSPIFTGPISGISQTTGDTLKVTELET